MIGNIRQLFDEHRHRAPVLLSPSKKGNNRCVQRNTRISHHSLSDSRVTDHISNSHKPLFLFVVQQAARYNPIGTHTWHLWPLLRWRLSHLGTGRNARKGKIGNLLLFSLFAVEAPEKGYCRYSVIRLSDIRLVRKTPASLACALVVSTPETTRGLYTLPSWRRRLSPKTTSVAPTCSLPSGKIEMLRVVADSDSFYSGKKMKNPLSNPPRSNTSERSENPLRLRVRHSAATFFSS